MDKKKKSIITVLVLNFVLLLGLGVYIVYSVNNRPTLQDVHQDSTQNMTLDKNDSSEVDMLIQSADNSMANVYSMLIQGMSFEVEDGINFTFGNEGEFSGYFDESNPQVKNYKYKVFVGNDNCYKLYIYNFDTGVEYDMVFNTDGDVILTDKLTDKTYILKY